MSSYSALTLLALERPEHAVALHPDAAGLALPIEARQDIFLESYLADAGRQEEGPVDTGGGESVADAASAGGGIHDFPRGAAAGSLLHGLLEWVFKQGARQALADPDTLQAMVERRCRSRGWQQHAPAATAWLVDFCQRPFRLNAPNGLSQSELVLADLPQALPEMEFWFGVRDADLPRLDALVSRHFLPGLPRAHISRGRLNGMLRGFIDLVFEHDGRYYVADYKSNWLGGGAHAYDETAIAQAMLTHRYDLQCAIYLFALHRLLKARLGEQYDYAQHVGGALVFFVRGAHAAGQGLHVERPTPEVLEQMEALFDGGSEGGRI